MKHYLKTLKEKPFETIWLTFWAIPVIGATLITALFIAIAKREPSAFKRFLKEVL